MIEEKVRKYRELTEEAVGKVRLMNGLNDSQKKVALDFLDMAKRYLADGKHFEGKGDLATALAAYSYAHAWLDAGVRARLFDVGNDDRLFTLP